MATVGVAFTQLYLIISLARFDIGHGGQLRATFLVKKP